MDSVNEYYYSDEVRKIIGCAMNVYNNLGSGFLEQVYQEALEIELKKNSIPFEKQKQLNVFYKGELLQTYYKADIICFDKIILELKSAKILTEVYEAQLINYLKATGIKLGVLINFGNTRKLEWKKLVYTNNRYIEKRELNQNIIK